MPSFGRLFFYFSYEIQIFPFCIIFVFPFQKAIMKNQIRFLLLLFTIQLGYAQNHQLWKGYFSYNEIKGMAQSPTAFFAASENALFSKNLNTNTLQTTNTIDGLSGETITAVYHSAAFNKTIVGYENGLMVVINEADGTMQNVVDMVNNNVAQNLKRINHFMENEGMLYISCDFGIVQYNIATSGFGDTYRIGDLGREIKVSQSVVFEGYIYAATESGILRGALNNKNLNDYQQWIQIAAGGFTNVASFRNALFAISNSGLMQRLEGAVFVPFYQFPISANDIRKNSDYLIVTTPNTVSLFNQNLSLVLQINNNQVADNLPKFTCATIIGDTIYLGTAENGVVTTTISNPSVFELMNPDGPIRNNIFSIKATTTNLWAVYGDYDVFYNPVPLDYYGISKYTNAGWQNTAYNQLRQAVDQEVASLVSITVNPKNEEEVYLSSFHSGLLKVKNDVPTLLYNQTNSGLESFVGGNTIRINGTAFDRSGNLWVTNSIVKNGLKVLKTNGQWQSYNLENYFQVIGKFNLGRLTIDKNGTKWMVTRDDGIIAFNENGNIFKKIKMGSEEGNLPINDARVTAVDNNNQLWIGTRKGLRVLSSVDRFLSTGQMSTKAIIILENDLAQELLYEQFITDIVVDGANNKWIGTADSGVFMLSPDGQKTLYHFTTSNSPLPSNTINDIDINGTTGEIFMATDKGMLSFKGIATDASENLSNVIVYPNPVRPGFEGTVKISGLLDKCNVKITDIEGNIVHEAFAEGGTIEWDTKAFGKYNVASGVYMIFISSRDGVETNVKKVMIIR